MKKRVYFLLFLKSCLLEISFFVENFDHHLNANIIILYFLPTCLQIFPNRSRHLRFFFMRGMRMRWHRQLSLCSWKWWSWWLSYWHWWTSLILSKLCSSLDERASLMRKQHIFIWTFLATFQNLIWKVRYNLHQRFLNFLWPLHGWRTGRLSFSDRRNEQRDLEFAQNRGESRMASCQQQGQIIDR